MPDNTIVKKVFVELSRLHELGFHTWYSENIKLAETYGLDIEGEYATFKHVCKNAVTNSFLSSWHANLNDLDTNPILRLYTVIKYNYAIEPYLYLVNERKYRRAIAQIRSSSHTLQIERGRHTKPKTPRADRICSYCNIIEDEQHFVLIVKRPKKTDLYYIQRLQRWMARSAA